MRAHDVGCILTAEDEKGIAMVVNAKPQQLKMLRMGDCDLTAKRVAVICIMGTNIA
jgi:hypothetical protein